MQDPNKSIAIIYSPQQVTSYRTNNPVSFQYADPEAEKLLKSKAAKSQALGTTPIKGGLLTPGVNWVSEEYYNLGIKASERGQEWIAQGILKVIPRRDLADAKDSYTGTIADYKGKPGATEFTNIQMLISNCWDRNYLQDLRNQTPSLFEGQGIKIVQDACQKQIDRIDTQLGSTVQAGQFYKQIA